MNILFSIHSDLDVNAGAPGVTLRLAAALEARGHRVSIISLDDLGGKGRLSSLKYPFFVLRHVWRHPEFDVLDLSSGDGWCVNLLKRLGWRRHQRSVTRSHGLEHTVHQFEVEHSRAVGKPLSWKYPIYHGGYRLWECRLSFAFSDAALLLNRFDADYAHQHFKIPRSRLYRVPNGLDPEFLEHARTLSNRPAPMVSTATPAIAFIGSYLDRKGVCYLAEAMVAILEHNPGVRFGLFGTGRDHTEKIYAAFPEALHPRIAVTPRYANEQLPRLLADYQILAFPSLAEGFPLAPLEAMACGLVPVSADTPGPTEYITDDENGLVVAQRDAQALRVALQRLIDEPALLARLRARSLATTQRFAWPAIAAQMEAIYTR